jgi:diguanylate cyclase (GGDEF)-like protein/PAS domain S-box-containing protein
MFGKAYALLVQPGTEFVANRPMRAGWISALVGLLLTAVLTAFVTFLTRRHSDLETQVRDRTALMQESERRTRAITDAAYDAILTTDPDGRVSFWNPGAERIFGYAGHEALGQGLHALIVPPDYLETHHATFPDFRQTGQGALLGETVDVNALRKDGREIAIQLSLSSVLIGGAWHAMGIVRDVTEQKRNEEQLHKMFQVVEQTPVSVVITDLKGNIEYVNPAFEQTTGYTCPEALGKNPRILKSGLQPDDCYVQLWRELSAGREWRGEFQNRRKNGELYWELAVISPLKDASGKINHYMAIKENITVRKAMEDELRLAAQVDKLTGLPNRAMLTDRLQRAVLRSKRIRDYHFAVLFLDFDRFKIVNDSLGHDVGDLLLQEIGRRLQTLVRSGDVLNRTVRDHTAARMGGDEFVILLDGIASPQDATAVADRMMESFARPYLLGKHKVHSTASIGIVTSDMSAASADEVLRDADTAMYEAKLAGKGQYMVFDVSMRQRVQNLLILENDLRTAMETGQLFLMYQPIVSLQTGAIESFEGLVRWKHPERGLISPSEFIPIAEDTGLIVPIGEWVLREACRQFVRWQDTMGAAAPRSISVNLSRKQLALPNLPQTILGILDETGVTPECLHLEVTESAVMRDPALANQMLRSIKAIGVKLDMDDFGTGYSSLACLQEFPIDVLKIDRSFIANIGRGEDIAAVVYAVTQLARNLKIRVVAEGIETVEQLLMLQSLECEFGQGYLFSKPMLADQVTAFRVRPVILPGLAKELPAALAAG